MRNFKRYEVWSERFWTALGAVTGLAMATVAILMLDARAALSLPFAVALMMFTMWWSAVKHNIQVANYRATGDSRVSPRD